jgi:prolipoprotein diacylglyceryl transferase
MMRLSIPTPTTSAVAIGPLTIHFYALCIIAGVTVAIWLGNKRFIKAYPQAVGVISDVAIVAVPCGVIGGRLYHVITSPEKYFGAHGRIYDAFKIWNGGLGIWGAIALGTLGAYFAYTRIATNRELPSFFAFADALAPGVLIAQAIGRWGNWFNGELFGRPLDAPWALRVPVYLRPVGFENFATFHPTFLYESMWCLISAGILIAFSGRFPVGALFALYISIYSFGRFFIEGIRIDEAHTFGGLRLNQYVALIATAGGVVAFTRILRRTR